MHKLPRFPAEQILTEHLKSLESVRAYEKLAIGNQIKKLRWKARIKQQELAKLLHTSQSAVARMEVGKQNFSLDMLVGVGYVMGKKLIVKFQ